MPGHRTMRHKLSGLLCLVTLAACTSTTAAPTQPSASTALPTPVVVQATIAPPTPEPPAPAQIPTQTVVNSIIGPDMYPPNVNPLTGLVVANPDVLERRPLAVKVSEFPRRVRPQAGLSLADLVFEHYAEAGVSRMTAIFLANDAPKVGSIRSARLIDIVLIDSYNAMLVTSGSGQGVLNALRKTPFFNRVIAEATGYNKCPPLCREGEFASTDNLFSNTGDLWNVARDLQINTRQDFHGLAFAEAPPANGAPVNTLHLEFQKDYNVTEWRWDAATGRYARWVDTENIAAGELAPHIDLINRQPLTAANVVVLFAHHQPTDLVEDFASGGHCGYEIQIWASGPAKLFRDGQAYDVTWERLTLNQPIRLLGPDGAVIPLKPGNTWFEVLTLNSPNQTADGVFTARFKGLSQSASCPLPPPTATP